MTTAYNDGTADCLAPEAPKCSFLSIDAWNSPDGWTWNNWHRLAYVPVAWADLKPRAMLRQLRDSGVLGHGNAGKVYVEDDGYNMVILARGTHEPLYALAYGEVQS